MAAECLDVLAQGRDLERPPLDHDRDRAVVDAGRDRLEGGGGGAPHHLGRQGRGGDIEVARRHAQQRVAHRPADHARLLAVAIEHADEPRERALAEPVAVEASRARHCECPGTSLPSSTCAGT
jgi:hypothetical protein